MTAAFWIAFWLLDYVLVAAAVISLLRRRKEPASTLAWILAVMLLPYVGFALYLLIGENRIRRHVRRRHRRRGTLIRATAPGRAAADPATAPYRDDDRLLDVARVAVRVGEFAPTRGNEVTIYHDAERTFLALSLAIQAARSHVHLEYYIFQPDETGAAVRDLLIERARAGVRCRLLLDSVGAWNFPRSLERALSDAGVEVGWFLPPRLRLRVLSRMNCRNHRKLVVIDGAVAFTGSQNIGDEYLGRKRRFGPWRDTHLRIAGPAAVQLQETFVEDWHFATGRDLSADDSLFPPPEPRGPSAVQIVASGPDRAAGAMHMLLSTAVSAARSSILIITPYFIPDTAMLLSLQAAAMRGVRVQLLLPSRSDLWFVLWAGRSYYAELLEAGVEIFEYGEGMLHSKVVTIDDAWAMVGSANMDIRSFRLNFELTAILYDQALAHQLAQDFGELRGRARRITLDAAERRPLGESLAVGLARLASPLL